RSTGQRTPALAAAMIWIAVAATTRIVRTRRTFSVNVPHSLPLTTGRSGPGFTQPARGLCQHIRPGADSPHEERFTRAHGPWLRQPPRQLLAHPVQILWLGDDQETENLLLRGHIPPPPMAGQVVAA